MLKPRLDSPTESYVEIEADTVSKSKGPDGKTMESQNRSIYGVIEKTVAKGDKVEFSLTLDRILGFMGFGDAVKSLYDTDEPDYEEASPMHKDAFEPILKSTFTVTLDKDGKALSTTGGEPIRKKLLALGDANYAAKQIAEGDLSDKQIKAVFGDRPLALYANKEVKVGDTWKKTVADEIPSVGRVNVEYDCKLDRVDKKDGRELVIISYKAKTKKDTSEKPEKGQRLGEIDATTTGTAKFDPAIGRFVEITGTTKAKAGVPSWFNKDEKAPLMELDIETKERYALSPIAERTAQKAAIADRLAALEAKRAAEEAEAMAGPVDPTTPPNEPKPWLQWGGPNRDFKSDATGLANQWPKGGPPKLWERTLGDGYSGVLCDGDTVYATYSIRDKTDPLKGNEFVVALDAKTGKTIWEHKYDAPRPKELNNDFGPGPHSTPLIIGDKIFTVSCTAMFLCLDTKTGKELWKKDLRKEHKAGIHMHGYGASPTEYKGKVLLPISKEKGSAIMAFNPSDGSVAWKGGEFDPGYATLLPITALGVEQLIAFSGKAVMGLDPANGKTLWSVDHPTQWGANITTPVLCDNGDHLFISSAYGMGSRGVKLEKAGSQIAAKEAWFNPKMKIHHADAICIGDWVYGSSGDFGPAFLGCVNVKTGEFGWRKRGIAKANLVYADGKFITFDEDGSLYLVKADPAKYRLLGKMTGLCKKTAWTVPTLVGRTLYIRDREKIVALDLGETKNM
jgi:outer membrane protein assembly factor BamB